MSMRGESNLRVLRSLAWQALCLDKLQKELQQETPFLLMITSRTMDFTG